MGVEVRSIAAMFVANHRTLGAETHVASVLNAKHEKDEDGNGNLWTAAKDMSMGGLVRVLMAFRVSSDTKIGVLKPGLVFVSWQSNAFVSNLKSVHTYSLFVLACVWFAKPGTSEQRKRHNYDYQLTRMANVVPEIWC